MELNTPIFCPPTVNSSTGPSATSTSASDMPDTTFAPASSLMQSYITPPLLRMPDMVNATVLVPL